jgi:hypothetical protein
MFLLAMFPSLEPTNSFVIGDEVIGALRNRVIHAVSRTADGWATRVPEFCLIRYRRMSDDHGQSSILPR